MFSLRFTLILLIILFIPFLLRIFLFEPYPAILLPSGPTIMEKKNNEISIDYKTMYGFKINKQKEIDAISFIQPIFPQYFISIVNYDFGLNDSLVINSKRTGFLKKINLIQNVASYKSERYSSSVQWLKQKLRNQDLDTTQFKVVTYTVTISLATGKAVSTHIKNEKLFTLTK